MIKRPNLVMLFVSALCQDSTYIMCFTRAHTFTVFPPKRAVLGSPRLQSEGVPLLWVGVCLLFSLLAYLAQTPQQ